MRVRCSIELAVTIDIDVLVDTARAWGARDVEAQGTELDWFEDLDFYGATRFEIAPSDDGAPIRVSAVGDFSFPYFGWIFLPFLRQGLRHRLERLAAGESEPPPRQWWAPPSQITPKQVAILATLCFALAVAGYCGGLYTQTVNAVGDAFGADDSTLGISLAVTRIGTLVALFGSALADRRGRRRILVFALGALAAVTLLSAASNNIVTFTTIQVFARGFVNLAGVVIIVMIVEEAPEGARAYTLALSIAAGGIGFGLGTAMLPLLDLGPQTWRILFVVGGVALLFVPGIARRLPESHRFTEVKERGIEGGRPSELVDHKYGRRFALLALVALLLNFAAAPTSQFQNRYLMSERAFSGVDILILRAVVQSVVPLIMLLLGGRLAEAIGRKRTARYGLLVAALADGGFFLLGGPLLWIMLLLTTSGAATAGPSLTSFNNELFPTEVRGTANGTLVVISVVGSVGGLLLAGTLSDVFGSIGTAVALTDIAPLIVVFVLIPFLPEAMGRDLDDISPPED